MYSMIFISPLKAVGTICSGHSLSKKLNGILYYHFLQPSDQENALF